MDKYSSLVTQVSDPGEPNRNRRARPQPAPPPAPLPAPAPLSDAKIDEVYERITAVVPRNKYLLGSLIISAVLISGVWIDYMVRLDGVGGSIGSSLAGIIAQITLFPHVVAATVAALFNGLGWHNRLRWCVFAAAIFYTVAIIVFPSRGYNTFLQAIICFVVYSRFE